MTLSSNQSQNTNQLPVSLNIEPEEKDYQAHLQLYLRRIANAVNTKASGLFTLQETANFQQWFTFDGAGDPNPQQTRSAYRITVDAVYLNGGALSAGTNTITLDATTQPTLPTGYLYPVRGFGGALDENGISYFLSDPNVSFTFNSGSGDIVIENNTGVTLTWCVVVIEYLKN